jgi:hypothetical protein
MNQISWHFEASYRIPSTQTHIFRLNNQTYGKRFFLFCFIQQIFIEQLKASQ